VRALTAPLSLSLALYVPHVAEEALTGMHDDPVVAAAYAPLAALSPRHAATLVFQAMVIVTLATALAFAAGGWARTVVVTVLAASLLSEAHHLVRAFVSLHYVSGLFTSLPMPFAGLHLLRSVARARRSPLLPNLSR
jgi:hypothetical protein